MTPASPTAPHARRLGGVIAAAMLMGAAVAPASAQQQNRIDLIRPDAPALASFGPHQIGVRTIEAVNPGQPDILRIEAGAPIPRRDRKLTLEVWYPATLPSGAEPGTDYRTVIRDGITPTTLHGRAVRDAAPATAGGPYPLVIISHGYPGNRYLMSHLGENLASKGYVTVSIDHADSTYSDKAAFGSTLVNRPIDQMFVLDRIADLSAAGDGFLSGLVDAGRTGLIGYSMGGYGAVISAGAGVTRAAVDDERSPPAGALGVNLAGSPTLAARADPRLRAVIAIAPWGMRRGFWDAEGLAAVRLPVLVIGGSADDVSGYAGGIEAIYEGMVNAPRHLLTFESANHNAAAPIPAPAESWAPVATLDFTPFEHYADAVWDTLRMNNIAQHFATAFFGLHLGGDAAMAPYLDLTETAADGVWDVGGDGKPGPAHTYWKGFAKRTAVGLRWRSDAPLK